MTKKKSNEEPHLGIFWLVNGRVIIDGAPLSEAEPYGEHRTHPRSHIGVWEQFQQIGKAPRESEYEEYPRGRVMFDKTTGSFTLLADKCILARKELISQIKDSLRLPAETKIGTDPHYKCFKCLYGSDVDDEDL